MKAEVAQQRTLAEVAELDAELSRLAHRVQRLPEQQSYEQVQANLRGANDRLAALGLALEDVDAQIAKFEFEIDSVRQRGKRDRKLLDSGTVNPKQLAELQHELDTLERRQASLEDSQLDVMERREQLAAERDDETTKAEGLQRDLADAEQKRDEAMAEIAQIREQRSSRREELVAELDSTFFGLYERQRAATGIGAGQLQGRRCGACRIELDRGEVTRISAAAEDEVLRCPECGAILLRLGGPGR